VSGIVYDRLDDHGLPRIDDASYQTWLLQYLTSADAFVEIDPGSLGVATTDQEQLARFPLVAVVGPYKVRSGYDVIDPSLADRPKI
jgi:hypothetical protein